MASRTAVELGADMCALARTVVRRGEVQLLAAETLDPAAFPGVDAFTAAVRRTRKSLKLPRRCRAVVWGLPDGSNRKDPAIMPLLAPLVGAGFRVERAISPCNALAALARLRMPRGDGATCWLAINRTGVAMIVVQPGKQLYSHSFAWDSTVGSSGSQARLLQRYSLVAFLAPEIRRAMAAAREKGAVIDAIVTCGNLPEIRSLTMPLIEELDVEVESLDSLEGLIVSPDALDRLSEAAASLRMACAGVIARPTRRWDESKRPSGPRALLRLAGAAAVILAVLGLAWWMTETRPKLGATAVAKAPAPPRPITNGPASKPPSTPPPVQKPATTSAPAATVRQAPATSLPTPLALSPALKVPASNPTPQTLASAQKLPPRTPAASAAIGAPPRAAASPPPASTPPPLPKPPAPSPAPVGAPAAAPPSVTTKPLNTTAHPADTSEAARARTPENGPGAGGRDSGLRKPPGSAPSPAPPAAMPELLKDPVPRVTAILVSSDRRIATVDDGRIIAVGDVVGRRTVVAIDERAVVLREPSGVQIRVALGGRVVGVARGER
jgi:hypothetical protein